MFCMKLLSSKLYDSEAGLICSCREKNIRFVTCLYLCGGKLHLFNVPRKHSTIPTRHHHTCAGQVSMETPPGLRRNLHTCVHVFFQVAIPQQKVVYLSVQCLVYTKSDAGY